MMTVNEVSRLTGVSVRTLQYYDGIGLLKPTRYTESGYRLYGSEALERLQQILLFRELEFSLKEIKAVLDTPDFDRRKALEQQIELLTLKREHLDSLISFARKIKTTGVTKMDFTAFNTDKLDEYTRRAKEQWGNTEAFAEFEAKTQGATDEHKKDVAAGLMMIFAEIGELMKDGAAASTDAVQDKIKELQSYITENCYRCTKEILSGLGKMYGEKGELADNIDSAGGEGTAAFAAKAIEIFCTAE